MIMNGFGRCLGWLVVGGGRGAAKREGGGRGVSGAGLARIERQVVQVVWLGQVCRFVVLWGRALSGRRALETARNYGDRTVSSLFKFHIEQLFCPILVQVRLFCVGFFLFCVFRLVRVPWQQNGRHVAAYGQKAGILSDKRSNCGFSAV